MNVSLTSDILDFHGDLQRLLSAEDEAASRAVLIDCFARRGVAGTMFFGAPPEEDATLSLVGIWGEDLSGELGGTPPIEVAQKVADGVPRWLSGWVLRRQRPFALSRLLRFVPVSGARLLRLTGLKDARPLADLVIVPYHANGHRHALVAGFHKEVGARVFDEVVSMGLAYTVKWIAELARRGTAGPAPRELTLTERELGCLQWMVAGKTLREVAMITGMSFSNVRYHVERAKERAGFATTQQLIAHAAIEYRLSALGPGGAGGQDSPAETRAALP